MGHKNEKRRALLLSTAIAHATPHIQLPIQWVLHTLSPGLNWPERETDPSTSNNPKDMNPPPPTHTSLWKVLNEGQRQFHPCLTQTITQSFPNIYTSSKFPKIS